MRRPTNSRTRRKSEETEETIDPEYGAASSPHASGGEPESGGEPSWNKLLEGRADSDDSPPPLEELSSQPVPFSPKVALATSNPEQRPATDVPVVQEVDTSRGDPALGQGATASIINFISQVAGPSNDSNNIVESGLKMLKIYEDGINVNATRNALMEMASKNSNGGASSTGRIPSTETPDENRDRVYDWMKGIFELAVANLSDTHSSSNASTADTWQDMVGHSPPESIGFSNSPRSVSPVSSQGTTRVLHGDLNATTEMNSHMRDINSNRDAHVVALSVSKNPECLMVARRNGLVHECRPDEYTRHQLIAECDDPSIRLKLADNGDHIISSEKRVLIHAGRDHVRTLTFDQDVNDIDVIGDKLYILTAAQILFYTIRGDDYSFHRSVPLARGKRIAVHDNSVMYITQPKDFKIVKLELTTLTLTTFVSGLEKPKAITVDPDGRVIVGDDHDIRVYEVDGTQKYSEHVRSPIYDLQTIVLHRRSRQEASASTQDTYSANSARPNPERVEQRLIVLMKNKLKNYLYNP